MNTSRLVATHDIARSLDHAKMLFDTLNAAQNRLKQAIETATHHPFWAFDDLSRQQVANFTTLLEYADDSLSAGETSMCPALIGLPETDLVLVDAVNDARSNFVDFFTQMDRDKLKIGSASAVTYFLEQLDLRRFNRKQTARLYVAMEKAPDSVSYFWASTQINQPKDKEAAVGILAKRLAGLPDGPEKTQIENEQNTVLALPNDTQFARVYYPAAHPRVNMTASGQQLPVKTAMLPILFASKPGDKLPDLIPLPATLDKPRRKKRSDNSLSESPVAPSVNLFIVKDNRHINQRSAT